MVHRCSFVVHGGRDGDRGDDRSGGHDGSYGGLSLDDHCVIIHDSRYRSHCPWFIHCEI